jgi:hypothetical protein
VTKVNRLVEERGVKRAHSEVVSLANAARRQPAAKEPVPKPATAWPPDVEAEVLERYAAGESGKEIEP